MHLDPEIPKKKQVSLQIWDTAGEERFKSITHMYYREAMAIVLAFDLTKEESFQNLESWLDEIDEKAMTSNFKGVIVGTKCDMTDKRSISTQ